MHLCAECRSQHDADLHAAARLPLPPSPPPTPSPPPPLFDRPTGCIDPLTPEQRAAIITLWLDDRPRSEIAAKIPCSLNTVGEWIRRWQRDHSLVEKERSGRPRATDEATDDAIVSLAEERKFITPKQIIRELALPLSDDTVRRRLDEADLHGRVARAEYPFDETDIRRRLSFAEGYGDWSEEDWERVIFSDETHIEIWGRTRVWVQRPPGTAFDAEYLTNRLPHSERVSLWGCFCARGVGQAEIFVGSFDAAKYVDILQHNLIQTALHFYPREPWYFQQDNAPQHTSRVARQWFHNHGVTLLDFPPYSPDLNPIENLWAIVKTRVEKRLARTTDELERILKEEWEALDETLLKSLAHSMPQRCAAVIANHGHKAPY
jgi:transposase